MYTSEVGEAGPPPFLWAHTPRNFQQPPSEDRVKQSWVAMKKDGAFKDSIHCQQGGRQWANKHVFTDLCYQANKVEIR